MRYVLASFCGFFLTVSSGVAQDRLRLEAQWETEPELLVPESVLYDVERQLLFVSNVEGQQPWSDNGHGSIAHLSLDGKVIDARWVTGLSAPKGLGLRDGLLYAADLDRVRVIDVESAAITESIAVPGARQLNDISIAPDGAVFVSDSATGRIHRLVDGKTSVYAEGFERPNGLLAEEDAVYVLAEEKLFRVEPGGERRVVVEGFEGAVDGLVRVAEDTFIVSCWQGRIYHAEAGEAPRKLLDTVAEGIHAADIGWHPEQATLYVPTFFNNTVAAYRLAPADGAAPRPPAD